VGGQALLQSTQHPPTCSSSQRIIVSLPQHIIYWGPGAGGPPPTQTLWHWRGLANGDKQQQRQR
jgi:hypothetical protein